MTDLINRAAIIAELTRRRDSAIATSNTYGDKNELDMDEDECLADELDDMIRAITALPAARISVVANITGGVLQGASATHPGVDLYCLDFKDGADIELDGEEVGMSQVGCLVQPDFVQSIIDAPSLHEDGEERLENQAVLREGGDD